MIECRFAAKVSINKIMKFCVSGICCRLFNHTYMTCIVCENNTATTKEKLAQLQVTRSLRYINLQLDRAMRLFFRSWTSFCKMQMRQWQTLFTKILVVAGPH